ncbi:LytR/AlgR family response regulator transcription factor [Haliscomenobacter sp.]|uniref:LytR/AlgR family response regulator transcription factor n=1 Tax=Haliscomenobacter sp. TaxID=2717303 RepID=UPI003BABC18F
MQKIIIIDDEAAGRQLIREYLEDFPDMIVIGEANNGVDAIRLIREFKPDLIFLDIQMPGLNGFDVLTRLDEMPLVIFSTAYDKYALKAFEVHALDYLLKPYTRDRFSIAVQKALNSLQNNLNSVQSLTESLLTPESTYPEKILVQIGAKLVTVDLAEVIWIDAEGDYSKLITSKQRYLSNYGLGALEKKLDPRRFIRVHRSAIINLAFVQEIQKQISSYDVILQNGEVVRVSRGYMENIKRLTY